MAQPAVVAAFFLFIPTLLLSPHSHPPFPSPQLVSPLWHDARSTRPDQSRVCHTGTRGLGDAAQDQRAFSQSILMRPSRREDASLDVPEMAFTLGFCPQDREYY